MTKGSRQNQKVIQVFSWCITVLLSLSFFSSPHRVQQSLAASHSQQHQPQPQQTHNDHIQCIRCVLTVLETPKLPLTLVIGLVVIGTLSLAETTSPKAVFVTRRSARAPPR
jgi:hypothetical protein